MGHQTEAFSVTDADRKCTQSAYGTIASSSTKMKLLMPTEVHSAYGTTMKLLMPTESALSEPSLCTSYNIVLSTKMRNCPLL